MTFSEWFERNWAGKGALLLNICWFFHVDFFASLAGTFWLWMALGECIRVHLAGISPDFRSTNTQEGIFSPAPDISISPMRFLEHSATCEVICKRNPAHTKFTSPGAEMC